MSKIAIIGMSARVPGAANCEQLWSNLRNGVESISHFKPEELEIEGDREQLSDPAYVRARSILENIDAFDAGLFGILPQEAKFMDPQHRIFLECCWTALEDAGYDPASDPSTTGVFAGCSPNSYFLRQLCESDRYIREYTEAYQVGFYPTMLGTIADTLATRVSYKLNLKGPSLTLQTACSTSLVAVAQAVKSLLLYECDLALAGGVSITLPQRRGYLYQSGGMVSPDGHCRAFDRDAQGTVFGSGAGVVLLKRLEEAEADGDPIYAVLRGAAINNDGSAKVGFTAPSADGQARVIAMAQAIAEVDPSSITYIEAHGTGTPLGDPIEVEALTQVFRASTSERQFCALGTAKTNLGHLDAAAGVVGLIKTALSLQQRELPPLLHFKTPNPKLNLESSPFYVNTELRPWISRDGAPLRAGVSAFGVGGTNVHVVLEEAPPRIVQPSRRQWHLIPVSARSEQAVQASSRQIGDYLAAHRGLDLANAAHTLQLGRHHFAHRQFAVVSSTSDARAARGAQFAKPGSKANPRTTAAVAFLFPGQGVQRVNMGRDLYASEPVFRNSVDRCAEILTRHLGLDLRDTLYPTEQERAAAAERLRATVLAQPAIFTISYSLARLWMEWGIEPAAMLGHSIGEFVAACLAGVFTLEDGLAIIARRGRLMYDLPGGAMLSVRLPEDETRSWLTDGLCIAAVNSPKLTVVAGSHAGIAELEAALLAKGVASGRLHTSHAFHSSMMDPITGPFTEFVSGFPLNAPVRPYLSSTTGDWIEEQQATSPGYWARHFRETVQFSKAVQRLREQPKMLLLEVGPGTTLQTLARQHPAPATDANQLILSSMPDGSGAQAEGEALHTAAGALWAAGASLVWRRYAEEGRLRVSLPTYPFERERYWAEPPKLIALSESAVTVTASQPSLSADQTPSLDSNLETPMKQDRLDQIQAKIATMFEALSGLDASSIDPGATFLELGFDSLFLTQVTQTLQREFRVKVTFRQLLDKLNSVRALSEYVLTQVPESSFASSAPAPVASPAAAPPLPVAAMSAQNSQPLSVSNGADRSGHETAAQQIVAQQIQAMSQLFAQQLEMLRGPVSSSLPIPVAVPVPAAAAAIAAPAVAEPEPKEQPGFKPFGPYKPVQKGVTGGLSERQQSYLAALIERYTRKTAGSKRYTEKYRPVLADPRVAAGFRSQWKEMVYPIVVERSRGTRLIDVDKNEYIDLLNGFGPIAFGHLPDFVSAALRKQLEAGMEIGPQTALAGEVAALISKLTGVERVTFCNTGSEAVMAAIRVARTVSARDTIVTFAGSYHGTFDEVLVKRIGHDPGSRSAPIAPGIPDGKVRNVVVLDYGKPESLAWIREHAADLAAVLVEPVQSRHPALQPREFLHELRSITAASGTALIIDEIVTGFRVHPGGIQGLFDIQADLVTYGKVLGGGMPIGVLAGKAQFMDALDGGMWNYGDDSFPEVGVTFFAGTFVRHPLALAAAKAVLEHIEAEGPVLQQRLTERAAALVERLNGLFSRYSVPSRIETFASIFYFSMPADFRFGSLLYYHLREQGIHIQEGFPCFLTTAHTEQDLDDVYQAFDRSLAEMQAGGVLPGASAKQSDPPVEVIPSPATEVPITEAQLEIWLSDQLSREASCAFNEGFAVTLQGPLHEHALRGALQDIVNRHEALRGTFDAEGKMLRCEGALTVEMPVSDLSQSADAGEDFTQLKAADARNPFHLAAGPLVRCRLVRFAPEHHVLLFTSHHIICDGWSTNIILAELAEFYNSRREGRAPQLAPVMRFSEYARQVDRRRHAAENAAEKFWLEQFEVRPPVLDLPTDRPRPGVKSFQGGSIRRLVGQTDYEAIKKGGARNGCTLFATLLAGFEVLLCRLANQDDIVVGIPTAGQSLLADDAGEVAPLVGHCVNFLPHRLRLSADATFADLLRQARQTLLDAYEHQEYTFGTLVRKLAIPRNPSRLPLIEVQFNVERFTSGVDFKGLRTEIDSCPKAFVNFDLFLNIAESESGLTLDCDYNSELFDCATVERWLGHYLTLLKAGLAEAARPATDIPLLTSDEEHALTAGRNQTEAAYPGTSLPVLFESRVAEGPDRVAVVSRGRTMTYAELNQRANRLAKLLRKQGVGANQCVAVCMQRSTDLLVALFAVLKAGAAYVPLDPGYPKDRIAFILDEVHPKFVLTDGEVAPSLAGLSPRLLRVDQDWPLIEAEPDGNLADGPTPEQLAYVIYTSGSTGRPKGVEIPHRALTNFLWSMKQRPGITEEDRLLAVTTLSFDIAGLELFLPLIAGARVVLASDEAAKDGYRLASLIETEQISVLQATPSTWRLLLEAGWKPSPALRVLCGGEALPRDLADSLLAGGGEVWNMYGPTETTIWSAVSLVNAGPAPVWVGPPIANTQFYVVDARNRPLPLGVAGELLIGGDSLAKGYFQRNQLTAEKFIRDPFRSAPDARLYRTGDLVRALPNGMLEFLGRIDHQVKIRGFRIELGEIEAALGKVPGIVECVVVAREDGGVKRLVAYYAGVPGDERESGHLKQTLARDLPAYMIPAFFIRLASLPRTPNGKLDRRALPAPDPAADTTARRLTEPRNETERTLRNICAEVLKVSEIGVHDNFFDLGADSIHVFQIVARSHRAGLMITAQHILRHPTVAHLSTVVPEDSEGPVQATRGPIKRVNRQAYSVPTK